MEEKKDILLADDYDLLVADGDMATGECLKQSQMLLLVTNKGEWKQNPMTGVGVSNYLENVSAGTLQREIRSQFSMDGMQVSSISINGSTLNVEAKWNNQR